MFNAINYDILHELATRVEDLEAQKASISQRIEDLKTTIRVMHNIIDDNEEDTPTFYEEYFIEE